MKTRAASKGTPGAGANRLSSSRPTLKCSAVPPSVGASRKWGSKTQTRYGSSRRGDSKLDRGQELAATGAEQLLQEVAACVDDRRVPTLGGRDERQQAVVELLRQVALHGSQQRVDSGEVVRGPGERHAGLFGDGAVGDGCEPAGDDDPSGSLDDRLPARRAPGATAVGRGLDR